MSDAQDALDLAEANRKLEAAEGRVATLEAALNTIASWSEGPVVNASFDDPGSAEVARAALAPPAFGEHRPRCCDRVYGEHEVGCARSPVMGPAIGGADEGKE